MYAGAKALEAMVRLVEERVAAAKDAAWDACWREAYNQGYRDGIAAVRSELVRAGDAGYGQAGDG
jgi:hypothetical protein